MDAFRIALMEEAKLLTKQNMAKTVIYLSLLSSSDIKKTFCFKTLKTTDKDLKNNYINLNKTSINNGKNTYKSQAYNHKEIN